jgi:diguanylate cyclase (GGDEF)-like protein
MATGQQEQERLAALDRYDVLDTPNEEAFDRITRLAQRILKVPVCAISLLDGHRQWFKSCQGMTDRETRREEAVCDLAIQGDRPLVINDTAADPHFGGHPPVIGGRPMRFYVGVPLRTPDGHNIGTLCALDEEPRELDRDQLDMLWDLARITISELELRSQATMDPLTRALSRRGFKDEMSRAATLALRHHYALSLVALDIDDFRSINDRYGRAAGDKALIEVANTCRANLRQSDLIGRLGGEEFAIVLPHTDGAGALHGAEKLRAAIERLELPLNGGPVTVTASFGVASLDQATRDAETLLANAEAALGEAKESGRNRVVLYRSLEQEKRPRRRVLKGGQILFNNRSSAMDCTVRSLSDDSAGLDVSDAVGLPKRFELAIPADSFLKSCRVVSKTDRHIEVEFG